MNDDVLRCYENAQTLMKGVLSNHVVMNDAVFPHWIEDTNCFWYKQETRDGKQYRLVDAHAASNTPAFNHKILAETLSEATGEKVNYKNLPLKEVCMASSPLEIYFQAFDTFWRFDTSNNLCHKVEPTQKNLSSPDGKMSAFVHEHNLWILDNESGKKWALTQDGTIDNCYASPRFSFETKVQALWSPDSKRLFTLQLDTRKVTSRPYIHYVPQNGKVHPEVTTIKYAYPGDEHVESYRMIAIDVDTGHIQDANYHLIPHSGYGIGFFSDERLGWWSFDSRRAYFVDVARGAKSVRLIEFDTHTGSTRVLIEETSKTFVKMCHSGLEFPLLLPLPETDELIWFSERTGWGHLYLYDLNTGELKHSITEGEWLVREVLHYDAKNREILVQTAARDPNISPYYRDICKVNIDSSILTPLVYDCYEYLVYRSHNFQVWTRSGYNLDSADVNGVSPSGEYLVTTYSRVDTPPVSILIDRHGKLVLTLEVADVSGLPPGWHWPEPIKVKSADQKTDIYGVLYRPPNFSVDKRYPVLDFSCGMRNNSFVPQGSFINGPCFDFSYLMGAAFAALGFIVVAMEGRGTPFRSKAFQDHNYGDVASTSDYRDRIAGIRQLAEQYTYMDIERVGVTCSDNLTNSVYGLLDHPEFYKVAVVHCFYEPRFSYAPFGEQYDGIDSTTSTDNTNIPTMRFAEDSIDSLKGKLLLIQGMLDIATPSSTFRLVEALQKANKDFDMLCLPNVPHDITSYGLRRNWDYLVSHLQGVEPPHEFHLTTGIDLLLENSE